MTRHPANVGACMKELSLTFKLFVIEQIPQEDHTGDCLKDISSTFKLLLIEQITEEIG